MRLKVVSKKNLGEHINEVMADRRLMKVVTGQNLAIPCYTM